MIFKKGWHAYKNIALFLFLGTFAWGTSFFCIKTALKECSVSQVIFLRVAVAFLVLQFLSFKKKSPDKMVPGNYFHCGVLSLLTLCIPFWCINFASQYLTTGVTAILNSLLSLVTFVLVASLGLAKGKLHAQHILGIFLGIAGVWMIVCHNCFAFSFGGVGPEIMVILACLAYAVGGIYKNQFLAAQDSFTTTRICMLFATLFSGLFLGITGERIALPQTMEMWLVFLWLGTVCTALGYISYFYLIKAWGPSRTSTVSYVFPLSAYTIGVFALGEPLLWEPIFGGVLIGAALFLTRTYK